MKTVTQKTGRKNSNNEEKKDSFIERILENLDSVNAQDWEQYCSLHSVLPCNLFTKKGYKGFNLIALYLDAMSKKCKSVKYATFNSISKAGGRLQKGAKGCIIEYFSICFINPETKKTISLEVVKLMNEEQRKNLIKTAVAKNYVVFNSELIENLADINLNIEIEDPKENEIFEIKDCENFVSKIINHGNLNLKFGHEESAYYTPSLDYIKLPNREFFFSTSKYYSTLFHEVIHWTGHSSRLDRNLKGHSDRESYSFEELIAEMGSMLCCLQFGIFDEFINSVRYLKGWSQANSQDRETVIRKAFTESKRAKKYLENL